MFPRENCAVYRRLSLLPVSRIVVPPKITSDANADDSARDLPKKAPCKRISAPVRSFSIFFALFVRLVLLLGLAVIGSTALDVDVGSAKNLALASEDGIGCVQLRDKIVFRRDLVYLRGDLVCSRRQ